MNLKSAVIVAAALAVVAFALYLFIQVRATPARANATQVTQRSTEPKSSHAEPSSPTPPAPTPTPPPTTPTLKADPKASAPQLGREVDGPPAPTLPDQAKIDLKMDNLMELANKAYDSQDFDQATAIAGKVLAKEPNNVRMLRIIVSANCIQGDSAIAQQYYERLPSFDREQMRSRCDRYGVSFKEPSQ